MSGIHIPDDLGRRSGGRTEMTGRNWLRLLLGCAVFGILMGIRQEFSQMWLRVGVAAVAGIVLALTVMWTRQPRA